MNNTASPSDKIEWRRVFIRSGFFCLPENGTFNFAEENPHNVSFLKSILARVNQIEYFRNNIFYPPSAVVEEHIWLDAIEQLHVGAEAGSSDIRSIELNIMDTYMAGIVRWANAAGLKTTLSCDGHGRREPKMVLVDDSQSALLDYYLCAVSNDRWRFRHPRFIKQNSPNSLRATGAISYERSWLLDVAEKIHQHCHSLRQFVETPQIWFGTSVGD